MNDSVMDRDAVKEKFDVWPEQIIDYLALVGDSDEHPELCGRCVENVAGSGEQRSFA